MKMESSGAAEKQPETAEAPAEEGSGILSLYRRMVVASPMALKQVRELRVCMSVGVGRAVVAGT